MSEKEHTRNFKIKLMGSRGLVIPDKQEKIVKFKDRAGGTFGFKPTKYNTSLTFVIIALLPISFLNQHWFTEHFTDVPVVPKCN